MAQCVRQLKIVLGDAFKVTAVHFEDEDVKTYFYKIFRHVVKDAVDGRIISDIITQGASRAVCTY